MRDALLLVDLFQDFDHADGDRLLASFRDRAAGTRALLEHARRRGIDVVYANDTFGVWDGDARALVERALRGPAGEELRRLAPAEGDRFVVKPRYSAFDLTPLELVLQQLGAERLLLAGMAMEMCVAQTAIDARERGLRVSVVPDACAAVDPDDERIALAYLERVVGVRLEPVPEASAAGTGRDPR